MRSLVGLTLTMFAVAASADPKPGREYDNDAPQPGTYRVPARGGYYHSDRPVYYSDPYRPYPDRYRAHGSPYQSNPYTDRGQLVPISGNTRAAGRKLFHVRNQPLDRIIVEATAGSPMIHRVSVEYADHNVQDFDLDERLPPGGFTEIDLHGRRPVYRMEVVTDGNFGGAYVVLGEI